MNKHLKTLAATAMLLAGSFAQAQAFPDASKPITIVVPFAPGGPTDIVARDFATTFAKHVGAKVSIENLAGGGSAVGASKVAKAPADGYTILLTHIAMATMPELYRRLSFSVANDFEYLGIINDVPMTVVSRSTMEAKTFPEIYKWLQDHRTTANLAHAGLGSASHLCGLMFKQSLDIPFMATVYKGTGPALDDMEAGKIDVMCDQTTNIKKALEAGKVKAYAVTTMSPLKVPPYDKLPTLDRSGMKGFDVTIWHGVYAPKGTPEAALSKLNAALKSTLRDPEFIKRQEAMGAMVATDSRTDRTGHRKFVLEQIRKWGSVIRAGGQYLD